MDVDRVKLIQEAIKARSKSYCPYSGFSVGAALLADDGNIYTGANIENASYGATVCAERTAIFNSIINGAKSIVAIAVSGGRKEDEYPADYAYPCGICRQVMAEFGTINTKVYVAKSEEDYQEFLLTELLPNAFNLE